MTKFKCENKPYNYQLSYNCDGWVRRFAYCGWGWCHWKTFPNYNYNQKCVSNEPYSSNEMAANIRFRRVEDYGASCNEMYGWFSYMQSEMTGVNVFKNMDGEEVEITEVRSDKRPINFPDAVFRGRVRKWVRSYPKPSFQSQYASIQILKNYIKDETKVEAPVNNLRKIAQSFLDQKAKEEFINQKADFYRAMKPLAERGLFEGEYRCRGPLSLNVIEELKAEGIIFEGIVLYSAFLSFYLVRW